MSNITDKAKEYLSYQLSVIPTKEDKRPALSSWKPYQTTRMKPEEIDILFTGSGIKGLGIICGSVSGGLGVIDVDCKYDTTGELWGDLSNLIRDNLPEICDTLVIAQTVKKGYHIYYRTEVKEGNRKLANRPTTPQERELTYQDEIERGATEEEAKRASDNDRVRVLIETRGEGGYVIAPPSPGYQYIQGGPGNIPAITQDQREILFSICKSFNELPEEEAKPKIKVTPSTTHSSTGVSPWEDYDTRGDVVALLESKGWRVVSQAGDRINLKRPGQTDTKDSGNFHTGLRTLRVFSTSTEFNAEKAYSPSQVFSLLECNGDSKETYKKLLDMGYGEPYKGEDLGPIKVKKAQVKAEIGTKVISTPGGALEVETTGEEVVITSPGPEAQAEVLEAIALGEEAGKRIYIKEGDSPEIRSYEYQLQGILRGYGAKGDLTARDIDNLLEEVVGIATRIPEPMDRDLFTKLFTSIPEIQELGITEESLKDTVERIQYNKAREEQTQKVNKLLSEATKLPTEEAVKRIETGLQEIRIGRGKDLLPPPQSYENILRAIAETPPAYRTGYPSLDKFIGFTPGAISLVAGRPSHGKTALLFNLLLEMSSIYPEERFYFFAYEEPAKNISIKLINRLTATDLGGYFREYPTLARPTNYEYIKAYIKDNRADIPEIEEGKRRFKDLVDSHRIRVIDQNYSVEALQSLIAYLSQREKIGAVFIDYIQRMRTEVAFKDTTPEIAYISKQVLQIAKDTGLPIILGAQLNRDAKSKPSLENLKASGSLEEDANTVLSLYNESREKEEDQEGETFTGAREVDLEMKALKNREGEPNKKALLLFDRWTGVIKNSPLSTTQTVEPPVKAPPKRKRY
jgi:replicative DNA helicase